MRFKELLNEGMYSINAPAPKKAAPKAPPSNDIFVDISEESANMIAVTLKGRTALIPGARAQKLAEKLKTLAGQFLSEEVCDLPEGVIAQADEWRVEQDEDGLVHLIDGENTIRATMTVDNWNELTQKNG